VKQPEEMQQIAPVRTETSLRAGRSAGLIINYGRSRTYPTYFRWGRFIKNICVGVIRRGACARSKNRAIAELGARTLKEFNIGIAPVEL
jgi:hypothetical protein